MSKKIAALVLIAALAPQPGSTQAPIPEALEPWRDWVLHGLEYRSCPVLNGRAATDPAGHVCAWPGELSVDVAANTADFAQSWTLYKEDWLPVPGDARYWPGEVTVDGATQAVVMRSGRPMIRAAAGTRRVAGTIRFETRPASIPVPVETGLISLRLDGERIALPELESGALWLGLRPDLVVEEDRLSVEVYRKLSDTLPIRVETRIQLDVAGQSRELALTGALLPDFVGESIASQLPAELDADGTLRMQIRPGRWQATLIAHHPDVFTSIARPAVVAPWPAEEIWSFQSNPLLRVAVLEGVPAIDGRLARVPGDWQALPSFAVGAEIALNLVERSRNDALDDNRLELARNLWLDFDGEGFTAHDSVQGQLNRDWRLDMAPPFTMSSASIGGENLLVTEGAEAGLQGVELRTTALSLLSTARLPSERELPVTGYTDDFDAATTTLYLPPAYRLVAAPGTDIADGAWIERWRLLDIFLALIIAVASWRLLGPIGGGIALATMILVYHEPWAPQYVWLNLLLITALLRVVPAGRLRSWCGHYRLVSAGVLVALLVPFAALQLRAVVFPQLEPGFFQRGIGAPSPLAFGYGGAAAPFAAPAAPDDTIVVTGTRMRRDDFTSTNASVTVTDEDMRRLGATSVANMVNQLPANVAAQRAGAESDSSFSLGQDVADLRGTNGGAGSRTLTLADPRRFTGSNESGVVDTDFIPTALVGRIDTVTGGASATYGADAMGGVVNVIGNAQGLSRYQQGALVQTGPGLPDWAWSRYRLGFSGPIAAGQTYSLLIVGPGIVGLWRVASVALVLALAWLLVRPALPPRDDDGRRQATSDDRVDAASARRGGPATGVLATGTNAVAGISAVAALGALLAALSLALPRPGVAQTTGDFPPLPMLDELRTRLTTPAPCHPACAELTDARVVLADDTLTLDLELALQDSIAVPIPGHAQGWRPEQIAIDGVSRRLLYRDPSGYSWIRLEAGVRRVRLAGPLPAGDSLQLPFPLAPRHIAVEASGWDIAGVLEARLPSGTLELVRQRQADDGAGEIRATAFPPYVQVTRSIQYGIDWTAITTVQRIAPRDGAFTLAVALLPGEAVVTEDIEVEGGMATVAFAAGQAAVSWQSTIPTGTAMSLTAADDVPWSERWLFNVGHEWHAEFDGLPLTRVRPSGELALFAEYLPRPGETLDIALTRPAAVAGDTIAIDDVRYFRAAGDRESSNAIAFAYRSTRAGEHPITLPEGSELEQVSIDGAPMPLRLDGRLLSLPVLPGQHRVNIGWREATGAGIRSPVPAVDLGAGASNLTTGFRLPADRWILFMSGPVLGPAVLYWAELALFVLAALVLGRIAMSPLRTHEWLLLGLGLSTFSWPVLALFGAWAFLMSWRGRKAPAVHPWLFNGAQLLLALLTVGMLVALVGSIMNGLLGSPSMHIRTPVEGGGLTWFLDRTDGATPAIQVISVSLWVYKAAMLAWALWLSFALLRWLRFAWTAIGFGGLWRGKMRAAASTA